MAQWESSWLEIEGLRVKASPEALHCVFEQDTLYPCLVLIKHRIGRRDTTEKMLTGT